MAGLTIGTVEITTQDGSMAAFTHLVSLRPRGGTDEPGVRVEPLTPGFDLYSDGEFYPFYGRAMPPAGEDHGKACICGPCLDPYREEEEA
jgi:hypothetical protein